MDEDFEQRRELRRQKREEIRVHSQRTDEDEEEAARERRRRARQERMRNKDSEEPVAMVTQQKELYTNSVMDSGAGGDEQVLLERLSKCEELQKDRMQEVMDKHRELELWDAKPEELKEPQMANDDKALQEHHNGILPDDTLSKPRKPERTLSHSSIRSAEQEEQEERLEAEHKLEELRKRRDENESEELQRVRQKQQVAEAELEELKRKREERRKVLEEEEKQREQELQEKRAKEEEEKRTMKDEIERRRAEASEKRQRVEAWDGAHHRPFQCISPRGSSLKIGDRTEFLNRAARKSSMRMPHSPIVSKIDNKLEQYTSALESSREGRPNKPVGDLPGTTDGVRNIKSLWEKGGVFSPTGATGTSNKETATMKTGVANRINEWLSKTPEDSRVSTRPADLKPGDVTSIRNIWESKGSPSQRTEQDVEDAL